MGLKDSDGSKICTTVDFYPIDLQKKHIPQQNQCCNDVRYVVEDISSKVDVVYDHVVEAEADDYYVGNEAIGGEEHNGEPVLMGSGTMQFRALRRTLKKSNRNVSTNIVEGTSNSSLVKIKLWNVQQANIRYAELGVSAAFVCARVGHRRV